MTLATIEHGGKTYSENQEGEAVVRFIKDRRIGFRIDYLWELSGGHEGEPIQVWMYGVKDVWDEGTPSVEWLTLVWADDGSTFSTEEGWLEDAHTDPLRDELLEIARETWD